MAQEYSNLVSAMANITASANGAGVQPTYAAAAGFNVASASNTHTAAGVYALVLDTPAAAAQCVVQCTNNSATDATFQVVHTSDTVKTITTLAAGVASDTVSFTVVVLKYPNT
jgi:hypothetical protein